MAGIAGSVAFWDRRPDQSDIQHAMLAALSRRGHYGTFNRQEGPASLGSCWPASQAHAVRPAVVDNASGRRVLVLDGWLENEAELLAELPPVLAPTTPAECMLSAYAEWGTEAFAAFRGGFAAALWDGPGDRFFLIRDHLGIKPIYFVGAHDRILFASEPQAIFVDPRYTPKVTLRGFRELLSPVREHAASIWDGMSEVAPAHYVSFSREGLAANPYWSLQPEVAQDGDLNSALLRLIEAGVSSNLDADTGCLLSGGLDSSLLTVIASRQRRTSGWGPLPTFTIDFENHTENFRPDVVRPTSDTPYAAEVAKFARTDHHQVTISTRQLLDSTLQHEIWNAFDRLPAQNDLTKAVALLYQCAGDHVPRAISGEGADEIFGSGPLSPIAAAKPPTTFPWLAASHGAPLFTVLAPDLAQSIDLDGHVAALHVETLAACPRAVNDDDYEARMREYIFILAIRDMARAMERLDRVGSLAGLEVRAPLFTPSVLQLAFDAGYHVLTADGREKSLLRAAARNSLPGAILTRKKSNLPTTQHADYDEQISRLYGELINDSTASIHTIADPRRLRALGRNFGGELSQLFIRRKREDVLALNHWLMRFGSYLSL